MTATADLPRTSGDVTAEYARAGIQVIIDRATPAAFSRDDLQPLLLAAEFAVMVLRRMVSVVEKLLDRGIEQRRLVFIVKEFLDVYNLATEAFRGVEKCVESARLMDGDEHQIAFDTLVAQQQDVLKQRERLVSLLTWLERPLAPIDESRLRVSTREKDAPGYASFDALIERERSGK